MKHLTVLALATMLLASTVGCQCCQRLFGCNGAPACAPVCPPVAPPVSYIPVDQCATGQGAVLVQQ